MKLIKRREFLKLGAASAGCLAASSIINPFGSSSAYASSPNGRHLIMVYLRGGADLAFQILQPDLNSPISLPLNRVRPFAYDVNVASRLIGNSGYAYYTGFGMLNTLYSAGELAIVHRVGMDGLIPSHSEAELAFACANPNARSGPRSGWLQRWANTYAQASGDLIDLSGGHPTTCMGGNFAPLSANNLQQLLVGDGTADPVLFTRESGYRRVWLHAMLTKPGANSTAEMEAAYQSLGQLSRNDAGIDAADTTLPAGYGDNPAGNLFRDAEMALKYTIGATPLFRTKIVFGEVGGSTESYWDTHVNALNYGALNTGVSQLNAAINTFRTNNTANGLWGRTAIVVFSEMGRSSNENQQRGTDHGDSNAVLVLGGAVKGGQYGAAPSAAQIQDRTGAIPRDINWADVLADLMAGMGYDPGPIWQGYARRALGLLR